jgi:hypothetical protein
LRECVGEVVLSIPLTSIYWTILYLVYPPHQCFYVFKNIESA